MENSLLADLGRTAQLQVDETLWSKADALLWLWTSITTRTMPFPIGPRTRQMRGNALAHGFPGPLIGEFDDVSLAWNSRLSRWQHRMRKLRG